MKYARIKKILKMTSTKVNWRENNVSMKASHCLPEEMPSQYANIDRSSKFSREKCMDLYVKFGFVCHHLTFVC